MTRNERIRNLVSEMIEEAGRHPEGITSPRDVEDMQERAEFLRRLFDMTDDEYRAYEQAEDNTLAIIGTDLPF